MKDTLEPKQLSLYYSLACPYCQRVLAAMDNMGFKPNYRQHMAGEITLCDRGQNKHRNDLVSGGGKATVPCLRIEREGKTEWMYESSDIIKFLQSNFA